MKRHDILTITELADELHCHPSTVTRLAQKGDLPAFRVGASWRFSRAAIEKWISDQTMEAHQ